MLVLMSHVRHPMGIKKLLEVINAFKEIWNHPGFVSTRYQELELTKTWGSQDLIVCNGFLGSRVTFLDYSHLLKFATIRDNLISSIKKGPHNSYNQISIPKCCSKANFDTKNVTQNSNFNTKKLLTVYSSRRVYLCKGSWYSTFLCPRNSHHQCPIRALYTFCLALHVFKPQYEQCLETQNSKYATIREYCSTH